MAKEHLFYVQDRGGREVVSAYVAPAKLTDVTAVLDVPKDGAPTARILHDGEPVASASPAWLTADTELTPLLRVPGDDKLAEPKKGKAVEVRKTK